MTLRPVTIAEDTPIEDIVRIIEQHSVKHLPVMRRDQPVGIVTRSNLLQAITALARMFRIRPPTTSISDDMPL